jgi:hypothetical protein
VTEPDRSPLTSPVEFRAHTPGWWMIAWSVVTVPIAAAGVVFTVASIVEDGWARGGSGTITLLFLSIAIVAVSALPWLVHVANRGASWVRVGSDDGLLLSDGRSVAWTRIADVDRRGRLVVVHQTAGDPLVLRGVREAERLAAMIRRHTRASHRRTGDGVRLTRTPSPVHPNPVPRSSATSPTPAAAAVPTRSGGGSVPRARACAAPRTGRTASG